MDETVDYVVIYVPQDGSSDEIGQILADGIAGSAFENAIKAFRSDNNGAADGEITAGGQTWRKLLGLN